MKSVREISATLRPVLESDGPLLWRWANDPMVRLASFHTQPIPWEDHVEWFRKKLGDSNCRISIILRDGMPIGQIRSQVDDQGTAEVHISIAQEHRGRGIGRRAIQLACEELFQEGLARRIIARIKLENLASIQSFESAGFVHEEGLVWVKKAPRP